MSSTQQQSPSFLEKHWPLVVSFLVALVLCLVYTNLNGDAKTTSFLGLLVAVIPSLIATLVVAMTLYLLLRKDVRSRAEAPSTGAELTQILELLQSADRSSPIFKRNQLQPPEQFLENAKSIDIAGTSGSGLLHRAQGLLERQLRSGTALRVMLLDVNRADALATWDRLSSPPMTDPASDIKTGLQRFMHLSGVIGEETNCEVKLLDTILPFSLIHVVRSDDDAEIQVEIHGYRLAPEERLNLLFSRRESGPWYSFFVGQFELAFKNSTPVGR